MNMRTEEKRKVEHVAIILDKSGSMEGIKVPTLTGVNEQIQTLRKTADEVDTYVTLVLFDDAVYVEYFAKPLVDVAELTTEDYVPGGMTAMLDGVGLAVNRLKNDVDEGDDDVSYLLVIVSDGMENASREYTWDGIADLVKQCKEDNKWTVTYMGANQDLSEVQTRMNLDAGNVMAYAATAKGTRSAYQGMSTGMENYRLARVSNTSASLNKTVFYANAGTAINQVDEVTGDDDDGDDD